MFGPFLAALLQPSWSPSLTQDVVVPQEDGVVDLCLSEPRLLIPGGEDLHGHALPVPHASPHLSIAPFPCHSRATVSHTVLPCGRAAPWPSSTQPTQLLPPSPVGRTGEEFWVLADMVVSSPTPGFEAVVPPLKDQLGVTGIASPTSASLLTHTFHEGDLPSHRSLDKERQPGTTACGAVIIQQVLCKQGGHGVSMGLIPIYTPRGQSGSLTELTHL